jgi:hypothetical protein
MNSGTCKKAVTWREMERGNSFAGIRWPQNPKHPKKSIKIQSKESKQFGNRWKLNAFDSWRQNKGPNSHLPLGLFWPPLWASMLEIAFQVPWPWPDFDSSVGKQSTKREPFVEKLWLFMTVQFAHCTKQVGAVLEAVWDNRSFCPGCVQASHSARHCASWPMYTLPTCWTSCRNMQN